MSKKTNSLYYLSLCSNGAKCELSTMTPSLKNKYQVLCAWRAQLYLEKGFPGEIKVLHILTLENFKPTERLKNSTMIMISK